MKPTPRLPDGGGSTAMRSPAVDDEQSRLDDAISRADDLLVSSLKRDEQRRRKKWRVLLVGGLAMFAALGLSLLLLVQSPSKIDPAAEAKAQQLSQEGWKQWQERHLDAAAESFEAAVKLDPKLSVAWNGLGWARFNAGQADEAEKAFNEVIKLEPKHPAALNGLGQIYFARNQFDKAEKILLQAAPSATASWWALTRIYLLQGKWGDAERYAQKIVNSGEATGADADDINAMLEAARSKSLPDDLRKKIAPPDPVKSAQGTSSGDAQAGSRAFNAGNSVKAKQLFEKAIAANSSDGAAINGLGWVMLNTGDLDGAKTQFEAVLKLDPEAAGAMNGLARVHLQQGRLDDAIAVWEEMVKKFPGVHAGTYGLADAYVAKGAYDKAVPLYEQIVKANPTDAKAKSKLDDARRHAGL